MEDRWLLVIVFDHQAHLGLVKVLAKRATLTLGEILQLVNSRNSARRADINENLPKAAIDTIDLLFGSDDDGIEAKQTMDNK